jgi:nucleotide-binding universal stress UspA family protein
MKNILVPTDFSDCAQNAATVALLLARKANATIHFLHIMPDPEESMHVPITKPKGSNTRKGHAQDELNVLVNKATQLGVTASPLLVFDKGNERIENYIKPLNIDFIVMGSHGATGIREFVIGSNTQRVVRHSLVPILVIKNLNADKFTIQNIVFASTFEENVQSAFDLVATLAKLWKATINILFVNFIDKLANQKTIDRLVKELTNSYPDLVTTNSNVEVNDEEWGIHQFVENTSSDMIAITTHDKTGFLLTHSVAEDLVNHEEIPILVIPALK